uniref:Uncharacterized protein n=1 Tax=Arundo donax TaxID=35708 RepID=A0A0A8ZAW6_ARUDO
MKPYTFFHRKICFHENHISVAPFRNYE